MFHLSKTSRCLGFICFLRFIYLFLSRMCVLAHLPWHACEGQRMTHRSWFSNHHMGPRNWTHVIWFGCKHLGFICWVSSLAQAYSFELRRNVNPSVEKNKNKMCVFDLSSKFSGKDLICMSLESKIMKHRRMQSPRANITIWCKQRIRFQPLSTGNSELGSRNLS